LRADKRIVPINPYLKEILEDYWQNIRVDVNTDYFFAKKQEGYLSLI